MNKVKALLLLLIILLQYRLWFGDGNVLEFQRLNDRIAELRLEGAKRRDRNAALEAEVMDLKQGLDAVEEHARQDMDMIKEGEVFVLVVDPHHEPEFPPAPPVEKLASPPAKTAAVKPPKDGKPIKAKAAVKPQTTESPTVGKPKPATAKTGKPQAPKAVPKKAPANPQTPAEPPQAAPEPEPLPEERLDERPPIDDTDQ